MGRVAREEGRVVGQSTDVEDHPSTRSTNVGQLWGWRGWFACASSRKLDAVMENAAGEKGEESDTVLIDLRFAMIGQNMC